MQPDSRNDDDLVSAANRGEAAAFEALYARHRDWVVRLAYRFTGDRDTALDVLQDAFTYWLAKFPGFRLTASVTTFLYPVVKNTALAHLRKRKRYESDEAALRDLPAPALPAGSARAELADVVAALPDGHREALLMRFVDGMTLAEIAVALDIPLGTVKSRLHHALEALRGDARTRAYFDQPKLRPWGGTEPRP